MSTALRLISASIIAQEPGHLFSLEREWVLESEIPAYEFVTGYVRQYGQLPTIQICRENGHPVPRRLRNESPQYLINRIRQRYVYDYASGRMEDYLSAVESRNVEEMAEVLRDVLVHAGAVHRQDAVRSVVEQALARVGSYREMRVAGALVGGRDGLADLEQIAWRLARGIDVCVRWPTESG